MSREPYSKLTDSVGGRLDEWFGDHPDADAYEIVPFVLRSVVEELGIDQEDARVVRFARSYATDEDIKGSFTVIAAALSSLLAIAERDR